MKWTDLFGIAPGMEIADDEERAWLDGFRSYRDGRPCAHGYGPGDHHWESGCFPSDHSREPTPPAPDETTDQPKEGAA